MKKVTLLITMVIILLMGNMVSVFADAADFDVESVDYYVYVATPDGGLNMRHGPGTEYEKVMQNRIPDGVRLYITAVSGTWGLTTYDGNVGWVALKQTTKTPPAPPSTPKPTVPPSTPKPIATPVAPTPKATVQTITPTPQSTQVINSEVATETTEQVMPESDDTMETTNDDVVVVKKAILNQIILIALLLIIVVLLAIVLVIIINSKSKK